LKKALKCKLKEQKKNRPTKKKRKMVAPQPDVDHGQERKVIEMNTGSLYLYFGGESLARKAVFVRTR
jgi:hypothetical protein